MGMTDLQSLAGEANSAAGLVGFQVAITTTLGESIEGEIFNYDAAARCLILTDPNVPPPKRSFRVLNVSFVDTVDVKNMPTGPVSLEVPAVDLDKIKAFEQRNLRAALQEAQKIGRGVSPEAQQLFDALSKTYRCTWKDKSIAIDLLDVRIDPPYTPESCTGPAAAVSRVRRVVKGERSKIKGGQWS